MVTPVANLTIFVTYVSDIYVCVYMCVLGLFPIKVSVTDGSFADRIITFGALGVCVCWLYSAMMHGNTYHPLLLLYLCV